MAVAPVVHGQIRGDAFARRGGDRIKNSDVVSRSVRMERVSGAVRGDDNQVSGAIARKLHRTGWIFANNAQVVCSRGPAINPIPSIIDEVNIPGRIRRRALNVIESLCELLDLRVGSKDRGSERFSPFWRIA